MLGTNWQKRATNILLATVLVVLVGVGLVSCTTPQGGSALSGLPKPSSKLSEVVPPDAIRELHDALEQYQPQVKILSPRPDEILQDTTVSVRLQVNDLPLFKDEEWDLGPHLHFIVDNQPYEAIYDVSDPIVLEDLSPGTHTIRVFASRPWHESFKNAGAYAQTTFHLFAKTVDNNPSTDRPLLTYSRPKGTYGAEPIMLDFYLANAPLHLVARENAEDDIIDWKVRCTINGESFTFDRWEPVYLKGFKPGRNWVQLELLDEQGNPYPNSFNNTVRLIHYEPGGTDTLSKLIRGELTAQDVFRIVDQNYVPPAPEPEVVPIPEPEPEISPVPELEVSPAPEIAPEIPPASGSIPELMPEVSPSEETLEPIEEPTSTELDNPLEEEPLEEEPTEVESINESFQVRDDAIVPTKLTAPAPAEAVEEASEPEPTQLEDVKLMQQFTDEVEQQIEELEPSGSSRVGSDTRFQDRAKGLFDRFLPRSTQPRSTQPGATTSAPFPGSAPVPSAMETPTSASPADLDPVQPIQPSPNLNSPVIPPSDVELPSLTPAPDSQFNVGEPSPAPIRPVRPNIYSPPITLTLFGRR